MEWADLALLLHIAIAIVFVSGLIGGWILLTRAARAGDPETAYLLANAAASVRADGHPWRPVPSRRRFLTAWLQGYPWLGLTTGWMLRQRDPAADARSPPSR